MKVKKIRPNGVLRTLTLDDGAGERTLTITRSTRVRDDDEIEERDGIYSVICHNGKAQIYPIYDCEEIVRIGSLRLPLRIKEPTTQQEVDDVTDLKRFHYLSANSIPLTTLVVTTNDSNLPHTLGYVVLVSPLQACAPRGLIVQRLYGKKIASTWFAMRIARVVVHPEFRGINLAKILFKHAIEFSKTHWSVAGSKPLLAEAVAEMFKYVPFPLGVGMHYLGETAGAMRYAPNVVKCVFKGKGNSGISDYWRVYKERVLQVAQRLGVSPEQVVEKIQHMDELPPEERIELFGVLTSPKPFYAIGLNEEVESVVKELAQDPARYIAPVKSLRISEPISFEHVQMNFSEQSDITERTVAIQAAFGVSPKSYENLVLKNLTLSIPQGAIVLLRGLSGSGKTIVLRMIRGELQHTNGTIKFPDNAKVKELASIESDECLIELVGNSLQDALFALNKVGLAEAKLYLKRYRTLSSGQKYRACLAKLVDSDANIWIADEFCSMLDSITANIVAHRTQRHVRECGITMIVACANPDTYLDALNPDIIIDLSAGVTRIIKGIA